MKQTVNVGATSRREYVFIQDTTSAVGAGLTGLVYNATGLIGYYVRPAGNATAITLATQTITGAYSSGGFIEIDATHMPGVYRFDVPDAVFAAGVEKAIVMLSGAANMAPVPLEYQLVAYDPDDATRLGLSLIPSVLGPVKKNAALSAFMFLMRDASTHLPMTGLTVAVTRSIDGGAFAAGTLGSVTAVGSGIYKVDLGAGDLNGTVIVLRATATGADDTLERFLTVV